MADAAAAVTKRYVLCPGIANQRYYSAPELARRYGVDMDACLVFEPDDEVLPPIVEQMEWLLPDPTQQWRRADGQTGRFIVIRGAA